MAESLGTIYYDVDANLEPLLGKMRQAESALGGLGKEMGKTDQGAAQMQKSFDKTERSAASLGGQLNGLTRVIRGVIAAMALKQMAGLVQEYQEMSERVQMATGSVGEFERVQKRLQATADGTYRRLSEAQELYVRTADSLRALGYSTDQALDVQDSLSYAFVTNATSAERAQAAISQFTKALNTGKVSADQWEAITSAIPSVINDIAEASGMAASEVRALGAAGKLTAQDLSEGLRQSLDQNKEAADGMANSLVDAGVRATGALTSILVALESQYGALDTFTNAIIKASNWVQELAGDTDAMATIAKTLQVGVVSLAAVIAGRLTMAVIASTRAWFANAASMGAATVAANTLRGAMTLLGGPAGILFLVAGALLTFGNRARDAAGMTELLTREIQGLTSAQRELMRMELQKEIDAQTAAIRRQERIARTAGRGVTRELSTAAQAAVDTARQNIEALEKRLQQLGNMNIPAPRRTGGTTEPTLTGGTPKELTEFQKLEQSLKNQAALAKLTGLARAELSALQRLGADATEEERARIKELVGEIYRLEESQKAAQQAEQDRLKTSEEARKAAEDNAGVIAGLREQLHQTTLAADDLAARQAELSLNDYATPEQVEQVRALARELYAAQQEAAELEQRRSAFTGDAAGAIRGQVSPLSGGAFDDQAARYEAEAAAEQERYALQLDRLREAKELEIEVVGGYQALEEQMAQEHADRLMQIEEARVQAMAAQSAAAFGQMASDLQAFAQTFGAENSKMMAIAKAAAIAQTIMETYAGAQKAFSALAGIPIIGPALGTAAAAAAVAGGMARVAQIRGMSGRLAGGPVNAGSMYRVNENGAPEVFSAANGHQFMIPNQRGEVISNRNATAGGGGVVINIHNAPQGTVAESSQDQDGQQMIDIWVADFMADGRTASAVQGRFGLSPQGR